MMSLFSIAWSDSAGSIGAEHNFLSTDSGAFAFASNQRLSVDALALKLINITDQAAA
jgi:hypothetical protein